MESVFLALALCGGAERLAPKIVRWQTDYLEAVRTAQRDEKMALVHLVNAKEELGNEIESVRAVRSDGVFARRSTKTKVETDKGEMPLLDHSSFSQLAGRSGVAISNHKHRGPHHGYVVSILPQELLKTPGYLTGLPTCPTPADAAR